ncbi:MAG: GNAT family N-acetyltransferase [Magnetovibrio sp.]|nr:GNAT family N-acetyltransferase [Magnetovibrio sp.]
MSAAPVLRPAGPDDAAVIAAVYCRSWEETYRGLLPDAMIDSLSTAESAATWARRLGPGDDSHVVIAEVDGTAVGFASGCAAHDTAVGTDGMLDTLYLLRRAHGLGLGRRLTAAVADELTARGFAAMGVIVLATNPALRFYEAMGARRVGARHRIFRDHPVDEILLAWDLPLSSGT